MIVSLNNVSKSFKKVQAVEDVSFSIEEGEIVSIIGPSGSGKSTLLRLITQLEKMDKGTITLFNCDVSRASKQTVKDSLRRVGFIFQDFALFDHLSVGDNIALAPRRVYKLSKTEIDNKVDCLLATVGLADKRRAYPSELSGGQKQRIAIARALANDPELILFDEPTSALDRDAIENLEKMIKVLKDSGVTVLIVTHDLVFAKKVSTRLLFMDKSRMINEERLNTLE